ncbi:hypothetical protein HanXRQr2_Chr02g0056571 [Helianthus annuus]|uniref:Uncharacterized protein n=1 Tax=Helianthus annuus TaxID=4232 RepID=A0A9K3JM67_HELAN|nr:hypothetical protein HanXRQr2_Chr02g0056571 [Helianthus annuus]
MDFAPATDFDFTFPSHADTCYTSAPSSPTRLTDLYRGFDELLIAADANCTSSLATIPFAWEEKPGVPKTSSNLPEDDFTFDVSCGFDSESVQQRERGREREAFQMLQEVGERDHCRHLEVPINGDNKWRLRLLHLHQKKTMSQESGVCWMFCCSEVLQMVEQWIEIL